MKFLRSLLFFAGTVLIYLVIPLLGWGLGHLVEFFAFPPRLGYSIVVGLFGLAVGIQAYASILGIRGGKGEQEKFVFRQHVVRILLIIVLYITLYFISLFDRLGIGIYSASVGFSWLGVIFSAIGYSLIFLSGLALGRQYSPDVTIQKDHQLITAGIFRSIRHPRYLGIVVLSIGVSLVFRSWIGLIATLIFMGFLIYRIRDEEATMQLEFGAQLDSYCQYSWRLPSYVF